MICIILAAGKGTRMGRAGERIPKVMWPVYDRLMVEWSVGAARQWGCEQILITYDPARSLANESIWDSPPAEYWAPVMENRCIADSLRCGLDQLGKAGLTGDTPLLLLTGDNMFLGEGTLPALEPGALMATERWSDDSTHSAIFERDAQDDVIGIVEKPPLAGAARVVTVPFVASLATWREALAGVGDVDDLSSLVGWAISQGRAQVRKGRGRWFDMGTPERVVEAAWWAREYLKDNPGRPLICAESAVPILAG